MLSLEGGGARSAAPGGVSWDAQDAKIQQCPFPGQEAIPGSRNHGIIAINALINAINVLINAINAQINIKNMLINGHCICGLVLCSHHLTQTGHLTWH